MSHQALTSGMHHLGLSVVDLGRTKDFFVEVLGFQLLKEDPGYPAAFVSDGQVMLTLWQLPEPDDATQFDRRKVIGMHHFALRLGAGRTLEEVYQRLQSEGDVEIEFAPECLHGGPTRHLMCLIPGGIRMEIIEPAS